MLMVKVKSRVNMRFILVVKLKGTAYQYISPVLLSAMISFLKGNNQS
jgi:hypothetical protein